MQARLCLAAAVIVGGTAFVTSTVVRAQDKHAGHNHPPGQGHDEAAAMDPAMMQKMMELATPGEEHKDLAKMVGTWENHYKMKWSPDAEWMETKGTSECKSVLDGRYVMEDIKFDMMGMPMKGLHILGFDKMSKEYISFWADSMSTWWITSRGKEVKDGEVEMKGTMVDVAGTRPFRMIIREKGEGANEIEMYDTIPPHGEVLVMTISSKKKS